MNSVDASLASKSTERVPSGKPARRRSFTEKFGQIAFEEALARSVEEKGAPEAAYGLQIDGGRQVSEEMPQQADGLELELENQMEADATAKVEAETEMDTSATDTDAETDAATEAEADTDFGTDTRTETDVVETDAAAEADAATETETVTDTDNTDTDTATDTDTETGTDTEMDATVETKTDSDSDAEPGKRLDTENIAEGIAKDDSGRTSPIIRAMPSPATTFVDTWGRQAFSRSTQMHTETLDAPAELQLDELAEQIAKIRGNMVGGRARVVVGEGSERLSLTVLLHNGVVNIDARSVDADLVQSLEQGRAELAEALGKHGLDLGTMGTSSEHKSQAQESETEAWEDVDGSTDEPVQGPQRQRRGVRVVA